MKAYKISPHHFEACQFMFVNRKPIVLLTKTTFFNVNKSNGCLVVYWKRQQKIKKLFCCVEKIYLNPDTTKIFVSD